MTRENGTLARPAPWGLPCGSGAEAVSEGKAGNAGHTWPVAAVAWLTAGNYAASGLAVLKGIVLAAILGPSGYGTWGLISTFQTWSQHVDLGVSQVAVREMPRGVGSGDPERARVYACTSFWWAVICSAVAGLALAGAWGFSGWPAVPGHWALFPLLFVGMNVFAVGDQVGRGFFSFRRVAVVTVAATVLGLSLGYAAATRFGLTGLLVSQAAVYSVAALPLLGVAGLGSLGRGLDWGALRSSLRSGWSLLLPSVTMQVFVSLDVVMAGILLGAERTGLYAVALLSTSMVAGVMSNSAGSVAGQFVLRDSVVDGNDGKPREAIVWGPAAWMALVLGPACAIAALVGPFLLVLVLPDYSGAVLPMQVLLIAAYFLYSQTGFSTTLVATGRQLSVVPLYVGLSAVNVVVDVALVRAGWGIGGIAAGTLVVNGAFATAHMLLVARAMGSAGRRVWMQVLASLGTGLLPASAVLAANGAFSSSPGLAVGRATTALLAGIGLVAWGVLAHEAKAWSADLSGIGRPRQRAAA